MALLLGGCTPDPPPREPQALLAVVDTGHGRVVVVDEVAGSVVGELCMASIFPDRCGPDAEDPVYRCLAFGMDPPASASDQGQLVFAWQDGEEGLPGGLAGFRLHGGATTTWRSETLDFGEEDTAAAGPTPPGEERDLARFQMPHVAIPAAEDGVLVVADTLVSRVLWVDPPEGEGPSRVLHVLDARMEGWDFLYPNNIQLFQEASGTFLLVGYKGGAQEGLTTRNAGRVALWDVTEPAAARRVWVYPEEGWLAAPHHARVQDSAEGPLLLYAHSLGAGDDFVTGLYGAVGLAAWHGAEAPPTYLGDLVPEDGLEPFGFVREAEVLEGGRTLLITDSGCENNEADCSLPGRVVRADLPEGLEAPGLLGAFDPTHAQQAFLPVVPRGGGYTLPLSYPFEADLLGTANGWPVPTGRCVQSASITDTGSVAW